MIKTWISSVGATMIFKRMHHCGRGHWLTSGHLCTVRGWLWSCSLFPHGFWLTKLCLLPRSQALTSFCRWLWVFWTVYGGAFWCYARYSSPFHTSPATLPASCSSSLMLCLVLFSLSYFSNPTAASLTSPVTLPAFCSSSLLQFFQQEPGHLCCPGFLSTYH